MFTIFLCVAMYFIIQILRSVKNITERVEVGSETLVDDIKQLRNYVAQGSLISQVVGLFIKTKRTRNKSSEEEA